VWETWSRERLGVKDKDSETATVWAECIASLKARGWSGVKLVINIEPETSQVSRSDSS
jgi:transposase-like protein